MTFEGQPGRMTGVVIPTDANWRQVFQFYDLDTGAPFAFLTDAAGAWHGKADIRSDAGVLLAHLDDTLTPGTDAAHAGTVTFDNAGHVFLYMAANFTATLAAQQTYTNPGQGWTVNSVFYGDLVLTSPDDNQPHLAFTFTGTIRQGVTA